MKLRASLKYQLNSCFTSAAWFYGIVLVINIGIAIAKYFFRDSVNVSGMDYTTLIFVFVLGLNAYRESFRMMAINGRTRRTAFVSITLAPLILVACMAALDMLLEPAFKAFFNQYNSIYIMLYKNAQSTFGILVEYGWRVVLYSLVILTGVWINALYYRMSKPLKVGVSVGVPVMMFVVLPIVEASYTGGAIFNAIFGTISYMFGLGGTTSNPTMFLLWGPVLLLASAGILWALMYRAEIKE